MNTLRNRLLVAVLSLWAFADRAVAQVYNGGGLRSGLGPAGAINGPTNLTLRETILILLHKVLSYLALAGVVMIVLAGFYLVVSGGSDDVKEKVKKTVMYVAIGLLIVLFARTIVGLLTQGLLAT